MMLRAISLILAPLACKGVDTETNADLDERLAVYASQLADVRRIRRSAAACDESRREESLQECIERIRSEVKAQAEQELRILRRCDDS